MSVPFVLNEKQLEKQIKLLEGRIGELRAEMETLERRRQACLVLLGQEAAQATTATAGLATEDKKPQSAKGKKTKLTLEEVPAKIRELLDASEEPLSADSIYDQLKIQWGALPGEKPVTTVYDALEAHGDWFEDVGDGKWAAKSGPAPQPNA